MSMPHTILIADDSKTIQRAVEVVFAKEADFTVVTVANGDEAIARAREMRPSVVIADHAMPGKDGYQVAEALKADPSTQGIPVLILSGNSAPFDEARATGLGAQHLPKPFDCMTLLDRVERLVGKKAADAPPPSPFAHLRPAGSGSAPVSPAPSAPAPAAPAAPAAAPMAASGAMPVAPAGLPRPPGAMAPQPSPQPTPAASPFASVSPSPAPAATPAPAPAAPAARPDPFGLGALGDSGSATPAATPQPSSAGFAPAVAAQATSAVTSAASAEIAANGAGAPSNEAISAAAREIIEKVVWEVVPELAETLIREEIARLLRERQG